MITSLNIIWFLAEFLTWYDTTKFYDNWPSTKEVTGGGGRISPLPLALTNSEKPCLFMVTAILLSPLVMLRTFIHKIVGFRKLSITFYSFGLKQSGNLHIVGHKMLPFLKTYPQNLWLKRDLELWKVDLSRKQLEKMVCFFFPNRKIIMSAVISPNCMNKAKVNLF